MADVSSNTEQQKLPEGLRLSILRRIFELLTAAFSLVAALAWNDAIQTFFAQVFGSASSLFAKFAYAIFITIIVVILGIRVAKVSAFAERHLQRK